MVPLMVPSIACQRLNRGGAAPHPTSFRSASEGRLFTIHQKYIIVAVTSMMTSSPGYSPVSVTTIDNVKKNPARATVQSSAGIYL